MKNYLWYSYDFANSFASIVLIFYYPLILSDGGVSDVWIGMSAAIATLFLIFLLPILGHRSDIENRRIRYIKIMSILMVLSLSALALLTSRYQIGDTIILVWASLLYILFQVCLQGSYIFYSAILRDISSEKTNTELSGIGLAFGQSGNAVALLIIAPVIAGAYSFFSISGKPLALFLGGIVFLTIAAPFLLQKENTRYAADQFDYRKYLALLTQDKKIWYFIVGYSLLADAILTFQLYLTIFARKVFLLSDPETAKVAAFSLLFAILGGTMAQLLVKMFRGEKMRALLFSALLYAITFLLLAAIPSTPVAVYSIISLCGLAYGLLFSITRAYYSEIVPADRQSEYFSIYTVFERAASVIGPLIWIGIFFALSSYGENIQYRGSVLSLFFLCLLGIYFWRKSSTLSR